MHVAATPTRLSTLVFHAKALALQLRRGFENARLPAFQTARVNAAALTEQIAESRSLLFSSDVPHERPLQIGKIQNLRVAVRPLDGVVLRAGETFSFWKFVGRPTRRRGFVEGRELREGCLIASVGGGLCQLSNALYDAALQSGFAIVERHAHSQVIPGSLAEIGRDATVFWNYVDLRFNARINFIIHAELTETHLVVEFRAAEGSRAVLVPKLATAPRPAESLNNCLSCGNQQCHLSQQQRTKK